MVVINANRVWKPLSCEPLVTYRSLGRVGRSVADPGWGPEGRVILCLEVV